MGLRRLLAGVLLLCCACATGGRWHNRPEADVRGMMESTVRIEVSIQQTATSTDDDTGEVTVKSERVIWSGSGVVYAKTNGLLAPVHSRILTANHVLAVPQVGVVDGDKANNTVANSVTITLLTADGRTCNLEPLVLGENTPEDVATAEADCDAGRVAPIANSVPERGEKVFISGHSLGATLTLATEGYVSGWLDGYLLVSAPAAPGNSGGPVFYNGEIIGLLVRGSPRYPHISLVTPLKVVLERIKATKPL